MADILNLVNKVIFSKKVTEICKNLPKEKNPSSKLVREFTSVKFQRRLLPITVNYFEVSVKSLMTTMTKKCVQAKLN